MDISNFKVTGISSAPKMSLPTGDTPPAGLPLAADQAAKLVEQTEASAADSATTTGLAAVGAEAPAGADSSQQSVEAKQFNQSEKVDTKFSVLAKKEAALHRQREQLRAEKAAVEAAAKRVADAEAIRQSAKQDPIKALEMLGLTYEKLTEHVMSAGDSSKKQETNPEIEAVRQEVERLKKETLEAQQRAEAAAQAKLQAENAAVLQSFRENAVKFVLSNPEKYQFTIAAEETNLVHEVIEQDFEERGGGEVMSYEKAADLVEKFFEQRQKKFEATKKFKELYGAKPQTETQATPQAANAPAVKRPATLSNAMTASTPAQPPRYRTEQDRIRAALARLEGK